MVYGGILRRFTTRKSGGSNAQSVRDGSLPQKPWPVTCALIQGKNRTSKLNQLGQLYELLPKLFIFRCNFCDEMFVSATWMGIHRRKMHPQQWNEELERRKREKKVIER